MRREDERQMLFNSDQFNSMHLGAQVNLVDIPLSRDNQTRVEFYVQLASNCCPIVPDNETHPAIVPLSGDNENMHTTFPVPGQSDSFPIVQGQWKHTYTFSCPRTMGQLSYCPGTMKTYIHLFLSQDNGTVVILSGDNENIHTRFPVLGQWDSCPIVRGQWKHATPFPVRGHWDSCPIVRGQWKHTYTFSCPRTMGQLTYCPGTMKTYIYFFLCPDNGTVVLLSGDNENMHTPFPVRGQWDSCPIVPDNENSGKRIFLQYKQIFLLWSAWNTETVKPPMSA